MMGSIHDNKRRDWFPWIIGGLVVAMIVIAFVPELVRKKPHVDLPTEFKEGWHSLYDDRTFDTPLDVVREFDGCQVMLVFALQLKYEYAVDDMRALAIVSAEAAREYGGRFCPIVLVTGYESDYEVAEFFWQNGIAVPFVVTGITGGVDYGTMSIGWRLNETGVDARYWATSFNLKTDRDSLRERFGEGFEMVVFLRAEIKRAFVDRARQWEFGRE